MGATHGHCQRASSLRADLYLPRWQGSAFPLFPRSRIRAESRGTGGIGRARWFQLWAREPAVALSNRGALGAPAYAGPAQGCGRPWGRGAFRRPVLGRGTAVGTPEFRGALLRGYRASGMVRASGSYVATWA